MKAFIIKTFIAMAILLFALEYMPQANAQEIIDEQQGVQQGDLQTEGAQKQDSAITDSLKEEEAPPPPEAPYPGASEEGFSQKTSQAPESTTPQNQTIRIEQPIKKEKDGTYYYGVKGSPHSRTASAGLGMFGPPRIQNLKNGVWFQDIYTQQRFPTLLVDYEWELKTFLGDFGAKVGGGLFYSQGTGRFSDPTRKYDTPDTNYGFMMVPLTLGAMYRLQFAEKQPLVPFAEAGAGYWPFMEVPNGGGSIKFAGAPVTYFAAGGALLLDWLDPKSIRDLDREYGISHVYLNVEFREIVGLSDKYDFTSNVFGGGVTFTF